MSYIITITDLKLMTRIGWTESERAFPQQLICNLKLEILAKNVAKYDELEDTVDYDKVISTIQELCSTNNCRLLETLSANIKCTLEAKYNDISNVTVSLSKVINPYCSMVTVSI